MDNPTTKFCSRCQNHKALTSFGKNKSEKDGRQRWCRDCRTLHYQKNRESILAKQAEYRSTHGEEARLRARSWRAANLERKRSTDAEYRRRNRERIRAYFREYEATDYRKSYNRDYRQKNRVRINKLIQGCKDRYKERYRLLTNRWRKENPERVRAYRLKWQRNNPERVRGLTRAYQARKRGALVGSVDYAVIWERDNGFCHVCGMKVLPVDVHFDHVIPLSRGGAHSMENVAVAHSTCNLRKGSKLLSEM